MNIDNSPTYFVAGIANLRVGDLSFVQHHRATLIGRVNKVWSMGGEIAIAFGDNTEPTHRWRNNKWEKVTYLSLRGRS
jgi:hypothetical protein